MKRIVGIICYMVVSSVMALEHTSQVKYYLLANGKDPKQDYKQYVKISGGSGFGLTLDEWTVPGLARPTDAQLVPVSQAYVADLPAKYRKLVGADWVECTPAEKAAADAAEDAAFQNAKSVKRKKLENDYLTICDQILALFSDPRAGTHVKLSADEIDAFTVAASAGQENKMSKFTSRMAGTVRQLDKEAANWFDNIVWHP